MSERTVLITDVDNTLFDWVDFWGQSFGAMMRTIAKTEKIDPSVLFEEVKQVHRTHGTSEYAFMLEELPYIKNLDPVRQYKLIREGNEAFSNARDANLRLYKGVIETLKSLKSKGIYIVAYTESYSRYTGLRFNLLGLDGLIDVLYAPEDHHASIGQFAHLTHSPLERAVLNDTQVRNTPKGEIKPNPAILRAICEEIGEEPSHCIYVGDNLMKDIAMAREVGMLDVHAAYGKADHRQEYEMLRSVTHWTDEDVERERRINSGAEVKPSIVLKRSFAEILRHI